MAYEHILVETHGNVGLIILNQPKTHNALSSALVKDLSTALAAFEDNADIGAIVLTGSDKAFAAGADIKEMLEKDYISAFTEDFISTGWECVASCRKPVIAAVAGHALGGGCEIAMMCDFIIAADNARFGQPEINVGTMPGAGGTQRLTRIVGKSKAMEMCLTGRPMTAEEAEHVGLVSRVVPLDALREDTIKTAQRIAEMSRPIAMMVKESVNSAYESTLREGLLFERRAFYATFATEDRKEGMAAFLEKREPNFKHR